MWQPGLTLGGSCLPGTPGADSHPDTPAFAQGSPCAGAWKQARGRNAILSSWLCQPNVPWCLCCLSCSLPFVLEGSGCPHPAPELLQVWTSHLTVDLRAELQKINEAKANEALHARPSGCQHGGWHLCSMMASGCVFPFSPWHKLLLRAAAMLN